MKASEYKKLASQKQVVEEVELPSSTAEKPVVIKMRLAPIQQWVATGILPASLATKMEAVASTGASEDEMAQKVLASFTEQDFIDQQQLSKRLLEYCAVEPKVKIDAGPDDDAITPEDILPDDFVFIMKWIWSGGKQGEALSNFRTAQG